jgi:hypothetical protein
MPWPLIAAWAFVGLVLLLLIIGPLWAAKERDMHDLTHHDRQRWQRQRMLRRLSHDAQAHDQRVVMATGHVCKHCSTAIVGADTICGCEREAAQAVAEAERIAKGGMR